MCYEKNILKIHLNGMTTFKKSFFFQISFFVSGYAIPLVLIIILYLCMLKRLWHPVGNKMSRESLRNKRRVTRLVLVIIIVFAVCWAPIQVSQ